MNASYYIGPKRYDTEFLKAQNLISRSAQGALKNIKDRIQFIKGVDDLIRRKGVLDASLGGGGYTVPEDYESDVALLGQNESQVAPRATILETTTNEKPIPCEASQAAVTSKPESTQTSSDEPTFTAWTAVIRWIGALVTASRELYADSDLVSYLLKSIFAAIGLELDKNILANSGILCSGIPSVATQSIVLAGSNFSSIALTNLSDAVEMITGGRHSNLALIVGRSQACALYGSSTTNLRPVWDPVAKVNRIMGFIPLLVSEAISSTDEAGATFGVLGDYSAVTLVRRQGMHFSLDEGSGDLFTKDQVRLKFSSRWGAGITDLGAFVHIKNGGE